MRIFYLNPQYPPSKDFYVLSRTVFDAVCEAANVFPVCKDFVRFHINAGLHFAFVRNSTHYTHTLDKSVCGEETVCLIRLPPKPLNPTDQYHTPNNPEPNFHA